MTRPPPTPPLFPYTTLFRSIANPAEHDNHEAVDDVTLPEIGRDIVNLAQRHPGHPGHPGAETEGQRVDPRRADAQDRKSTRLNSSHPSISYAVFCLKKKKNK